MRVLAVNTYEDVSRQGARVFREMVSANPAANVVLAMGNTPMGMYEVLTEDIEAGVFSPAQLTVFQLDAYAHLAKDDPRSLSGWLHRAVIAPWHLDDGQVVLLPDDCADPEQMCAEYVSRVNDKGGFDVAVLGLGPNGHLGFNEPPANPAMPTRVVELTPESIRSNAGYWGGEDRVPRTSVTAGMDLLLKSRQIILLVSGAHKRDILCRALTEPVTDEIPASHLQTHPNTLVIVDKDAYSVDLAKYKDGSRLLP